MEVADLPIVKDVPHWQVVEGVLIVEYILLKGADSVFILFDQDGGVGFMVGDGLKETVGNVPEQHCIDLRLCLKHGLDGVWGEGNWLWRRHAAWRELEQGFIW